MSFLKTASKDYFLKTPSKQHFIEHHHHYFKDDLIEVKDWLSKEMSVCFKDKSDNVCFALRMNGKVETNYFVGIDWVIENEKAVYVQPKLNSSFQTDYLQMLFEALKEPEFNDYTEDIFEIKWDKPSIEIEQQNDDLLTPLLIVQYLSIIKRIVKKGLKKSYYKTERNLYAKVKGKVLVAETLKKNILNNKALYTYCKYDEFGVDGLENRLLKKALLFVQRIIGNYPHLDANKYVGSMYSFIMPAFENVGTEVDINEINHHKGNAFYKDYEQALKLARLILKRFGYNISNTEIKKITTPPFWIDMSKLFELYVFSILKRQFPSSVTYQDKVNSGITDFLLVNPNDTFIIDTKYKIRYKNDYVNDIIDDIRQLSGYARDKECLGLLGFKEGDFERCVPKCLIIYPSTTSLSKEDTTQNLTISLSDKVALGGFVEFYKIAVKLPAIG